MKRILRILEEKGTKLWLLSCIGLIGFLYLASITLLTVKILLA